MPAAIAGLFFAVGTFGYAVVYAAVVFGLSYVVNRVLAPSTRKDNGRGTSQLVNYFNTEAPLSLVIGRTRIGGMETIPPTLSGVSFEVLNKVITLAGHEVDSYESVYFNNDLISGGDIGAITGTTNDGLVSAGTYANLAYIRRYYGTSSQTVDWKLNNQILIGGELTSSTFTTAFRGLGIAYTALSFTFNQDVYRGAPQVSLDVNGAKMYDPRQDSTVNGGSGSHRADDSTTWTYPINPSPALAIGWYLLTATGGDYAKGEINWPTFITSANTCDALVATAIPFATFTNVGNGTNDGRNFTKSSGSTAWDSGSYSTDSIKSGSISISLYASGKSAAFGLHTSAALPASSRDGAYMIVFGATTIIVRELGVDKITITRTAVAGTDWAKIEYVGTAIRYIVNGKIVRTTAVATANQALYMNVGQNEVGAGIIVGSQPRYSCNGQFFAATTPDEFIANCKDLATAMLGRLVYTNGTWSCFAGTWQTPTFTIAKSDWCSPVSIRFDGGIGARYNRMHTWYIDPMRGFQKMESMPRYNTTYVANDGGKYIDRETDQLFCNDEYEAQRKGEFLLRQSRNQISITGLLPPRFQDLSLLDTGTIVMSDLGWTSKTFRIVSIEMNQDGSYLCSFQEEQSTDWTDLAVGEYNQISPQILSPINQPIPSSPTGLTIAETIMGTLNFSIGKPVILPINTRYQIIAAPSSTGFVNSGNVIWEGDALNAYVPTTYGMNYYSARAYCGSAGYSGYYPNSFGTPWRTLPRADNTANASQIIPDADFSVGSQSYWMFTSNSTGYEPVGFDVGFLLAGSASYVASLSGGTAGGVNIAISRPESLTTAKGIHLYGIPHPNAVTSYGLPTGTEFQLYRAYMRYRVNSIFATPSYPSIAARAIRRIVVPNSLNATQIGIVDFSIAISSSTVGSIREAEGYFCSRSSSGGEQYRTAVYGGLYVACVDSAFINLDIDYLSIDQVLPSNQPLISKVMESQFIEEHLAYLQNVPAQTSSISYRLDSFDLPRWKINNVISFARPNSSAPGLFYTIESSYFLTQAGTSAVNSKISFSPNVSGPMSITRTGSYNFIVFGNGLS